jgi:hypothetical protein
MAEFKRPPPRSFRISFETLFDAKEVEIKSPAEVKALSAVHTKLLQVEKVELDALYEYCVNLWSFIDFLRANRDLGTTVPLDFLIGKIHCNCYWYAMWTATNLYATSVAHDKVPAGADMRLKLFKATKQALGLIFKLKSEAWPAWTERGESAAFEQEMEKHKATTESTQKRLLLYAYTMAAQTLEKSEDKSHAVALLWATAYDLSDKKDVMPLSRGILAESLYQHRIAEYPMAIALAQAYQKLQPDVVHPELNAWMATNESTWRTTLLPAIDAAEALGKLERSRVYDKGMAPPKRILFARKKA